MQLNLAKEMSALRKLTTAQLKAKFAEVCGEPTRTNNRIWLLKRIAWRLQARTEGDLTERARKRAEEIADDAHLRLTPPRSEMVDNNGAIPIATSVPNSTDPRLPLPGTILTREYKGERLQVLVLDEGFEFEGQVFKSLSAVAKKISGSHCNGFHFFRLENGGKS